MIPVDTSLKLNRYALFAQDEWRVTPNLTLSYGLRWDYQPPYREADDQISTFLPDIANPGAAGRPGRAGVRVHRRRPLRPQLPGQLVQRLSARDSASATC